MEKTFCRTCQQNTNTKFRSHCSICGDRLVSVTELIGAEPKRLIGGGLVAPLTIRNHYSLMTRFKAVSHA